MAKFHTLCTSKDVVNEILDHLADSYGLDFLNDNEEIHKRMREELIDIVENNFHNYLTRQGFNEVTCQKQSA